MNEQAQVSTSDAAAGGAVRVSRFQLAVAALMVVAGALVYPSMPDRIPQHWNAAGEIDRWADKSLLSVFFPVLIVLGMIALAWLMPRIDPLKRSYERFAHSYYFILDAIVAFMAFIYAITLYAAFHPSVDTGVLVPVGVGLMLAVIGNQFGKVKRNFFMGIRTPWTLASERVWVETHRIGGRVFVVGGLLAASCAFLPAPLNMVAFLVAVLAMSFGTMLISYLIYRRLEREGKLGPGLEVPRGA